ncbi:flagellar biosynthesis protein FlhB [Pseudaeromonas sharmana]|uniref:Flagellar biosynthetic protein FlhB n=1 Tax=Pseudaeromonas sharmana TaxID=328412 RepID=A0ABV8CNH1_9GAMM
MSNASSQDKTEQPSARKRRQAREQGQVARSKELASAGLMLFGGLAMFWLVPRFGDLFMRLMQGPATFDWKGARSPAMMTRWLGEALIDMLWTLLPLFLLLGGLLIALSMVPGGMVLAWGNLLPKFSKLNPISGLKRMFSSHSLMELLKSFLKITLLGGTLAALLHHYWPQLLLMNRQPPSVALQQGLHILALAFVIFGCVLMLVALLDVPYQHWSLLRQLRMTKQEVRDEHKSTEGNPEIKRRIRQVQMMFARARIEKRVPTADVVIVNPTHYAVAICYDPKRAKAPYVIAKGVDSMALRIRDVANRHKRTVLTIPDLTRAIYYSTRIDQEVPAALYTAVAYVLNHVLQLEAYRAGRGRAPRPLPLLPIPPDLHKPRGTP